MSVEYDSTKYLVLKKKPMYFRVKSFERKKNNKQNLANVSIHK